MSDLSKDFPAAASAGAPSAVAATATTRGYEEQRIIREVFSERATWLAAAHTEVDQIMSNLRQQHQESGNTAFAIIKIKIIGDILMLAGNCGNGRNNSSDNNNSKSLSTSCFDMLELAEKLCNSSNIFTAKCGIHVGDVVSAVMGEEKISYDTFGDTINSCSRILTSLKDKPQNGEVIAVAASEEFCAQLGLYQPEENSAVVSYTVGHERTIEAKGKGNVTVRTISL